MLPRTGQRKCFDQHGRETACRGSGQDGEFLSGLRWPDPRFEVQGAVVHDRLTGLAWSRDANPAGYPLTWTEALAAIASLNDKRHLGATDWRLPNRIELRSLMDYETRKPALPAGHPFEKVFLGWYWSSTTAAINPTYAWYVHMEGARMFYGRKDQYCLYWPVRGVGNGLLRQSGQILCYDESGTVIPCTGCGQDGEFRHGRPWPAPRFEVLGEAVRDRLTRLCWLRRPALLPGPLTWSQALDLAAGLRHRKFGGIGSWRLPNLNELESLVDCAAHTPALAAGHPFEVNPEGFWSATTSFFETDWAWVLYLDKGACGVGHKPGRSFFAWPVAEE